MRALRSRFYSFGAGTSYVPTATPGSARWFRGAMPWHLTLSGHSKLKQPGTALGPYNATAL
jgi:hypothetical protein